MLTAIIFLIGLLGAASVSYGAWLIAEPAGYIVGGCLALLWALLMVLAIARQESEKQRTQKAKPPGDE